MAQKDYEIERLRGEMDSAQRAIDVAKSRLDPIRSQRDSIKSEINSIKFRIADLKHSIDLEYDAIRICRQARNSYDADNHRYRAQSFKDALQREYEMKAGCYARLDMLKSDYESALSALNDAKARKQAAREAFNSRLQIVKDRNAARRAEWKETACKKCGKPIQYHIDWKRVPNLCKECAAKEKAKWHETSCKKCGAPIRYHEEWSHKPTICKECKAKVH